MTTLTSAFTSDPVELRTGATEDDLQVVIRAAYKQVLGNAHLLSSERLESAESQLRNGDIDVRGFITAIAQSNLYKSLFFEKNPPYRFVELNCKHFLGRAPLDQAEISEHVRIYNEQGYEAEISSYIDSEEYLLNFGGNIVPYAQNIQSQIGMTTNSFNQTVSLLGGYATSDASSDAQLTSSLAGNAAQKVKVASSNGGASGATNKRFRISVTKAGLSSVTRLSNVSYEVAYAQLSRKIQNIQKNGGQILSIAEVF